MVAKGESYGTLYCLCGDMVTNHAVATTSRNAQDALMLRHRRLRHRSEKVLKILHDRGMLFGIKSCNSNLYDHCIFGK